jgi:hypothetical protein
MLEEYFGERVGVLAFSGAKFRVSSGLIPDDDDEFVVLVRRKRPESVHDYPLIWVAGFCRWLFSGEEAILTGREVFLNVPDCPGPNVGGLDEFLEELIRIGQLWMHSDKLTGDGDPHDGGNKSGGVLLAPDPHYSIFIHEHGAIEASEEVSFFFW